MYNPDIITFFKTLSRTELKQYSFLKNEGLSDMRIAMFSEVPTFNPALPNGISSFIEATTQQMAKLGHDVHIYDPALFIGQKKEVKLRENLTKHNIFSIGVGAYKGFRTALPFGTVFKRLKVKYDIIHAHGPINGLAASAIGKFNNITKIVHYHTPGNHYSHYAPWFTPLRYNTIVNLLEKLVYNSYDLVLTPANKIRKDLVERGFDAHKLFVLPNCVNIEAYRNCISEDRIQTLKDKYNLNGKKIVLYVGRMSPEKRIPDIINLAPRIVKEDPDTHFLLVGKGPYLDHYRSLARRIAPKCVTLPGYIDDYDLSNILEMSSIGVIFVDGAQVFDITLLNYWSNNLAVCARRAGGMGDVISHNDNGILFNKPSEAYYHLVNLVQDDKLCRQLGQRGFETVKKKYTAKVVTEQLLKYYKLAAEKYHVRGKSVLKHFLRFFKKK